MKSFTERIVRHDRTGNLFEIGICEVNDFSCLIDMYDNFLPRPASQGLPPEDPETCHNWVKGLFEIGDNIIAWKGGKVIGHACLVPDLKGKSGEFVIFVNQNYRNLGVGTELTGYSLERAKCQGFESVWLTVANSNNVAIRLYTKVGFQFCELDACERTMRIGL